MFAHLKGERRWSQKGLKRLECAKSALGSHTLCEHHCFLSTWYVRHIADVGILSEDSAPFNFLLAATVSRMTRRSCSTGYGSRKPACHTCLIRCLTCLQTSVAGLIKIATLHQALLCRGLPGEQRSDNATQWGMIICLVMLVGDATFPILIFSG